MQVTTRIVIDIETGKILEHEFFEYEGIVALAKGDDTAKQSEQQQAQFNQQLMSIFQQQFANQQGILNFLKGGLENQVTNPQGYTPAEMANLKSEAISSSAQAFQNAAQAVGNKFASQGDMAALPSGVAAQIQGQLSNAQAVDQSQKLSSIQDQDAQLAQNNYWNAVNALSGQAAQLNPLGYANSATSGGNTVANLSNAVTNSEQSGLAGALIGGVFGAGGSLLGNPGLFGGKGCWIAEAIWGADDDRTAVVRAWLNEEYGNTFVGSFVMNAYLAFGETVAAMVRKIPIVRFLMTPLFNSALKRADAWLGV